MGFLDWIIQMAQTAAEQMQAAAMEALTQLQMLEEASWMAQQASDLHNQMTQDALQMTDLHSGILDQDLVNQDFMNQDFMNQDFDFTGQDFMDFGGGMDMF